MVPLTRSLFLIPVVRASDKTTLMIWFFYVLFATSAALLVTYQHSVHAIGDALRAHARWASRMEAAHSSSHVKYTPYSSSIFHGLGVTCVWVGRLATV